MKTADANNPSFRARLAAFLVVLAVGFVMGLVNGRGGSTGVDVATGIVASQGGGSQAEGNDLGATQEGEAAKPSDGGATTSGDADPAVSESGTASSDAGTSTVAPERGPTVEEDGWYTSKDEVALYIHTYGHLPGNFISKTKARNRGWDASAGNLDKVCPGMSIGGSRFYNDEGQLPDARGRQWTECDINYQGGYRGAERIVFSNDGLVFYTGDHYKTFEQLY